MPTARETAVARVTRLGGTVLRPAISTEDVGLIVDGCAIVDVNGVPPNGTGWTPTYDTNAAVAEVWAQKAAQVAGDFDFRADDAEYSKGDVLSHMLAMEAKYRALVVPVDRGGRTAPGMGTFTVGGTNSGLSNPLDQIARQVIP